MGVRLHLPFHSTGGLQGVPCSSPSLCCGMGRGEAAVTRRPSGSLLWLHSRLGLQAVISNIRPTAASLSRLASSLGQGKGFVYWLFKMPTWEKPKPNMQTACI